MGLGGAFDAVEELISWGKGEPSVIGMSRAELVALVRARAASWGWDPDWWQAIAEHESHMNPRARNLTGGDAARGGSYGLMQISLKSARAWMKDPDFTPEQLYDPNIHLAVAGTGFATFKPAPKSLEDAAALWNAGRRFADLPIDHQTRTAYVPAVLLAYSAIQSSKGAA